MAYTITDNYQPKGNIGYVFSEFRSKVLEHRFRQYILGEDKRRGALLIIASSIVIVLLLFSDFINWGSSVVFIETSILRSLSILLNIFLLYLIRKTFNENTFDLFLLLFAISVCLLNFYIGRLRPPGYVPYAVFEVIIITAIYIIMPSRIIYKLIPCFLITLISPSLRSTGAISGVNGLLIAHLTSHIIGFLFSNISNKNRRLQYSLFINETRLKNELQKAEKKNNFISERLAKQNKALLESATKDQLTGIHNRRSVYEFAEEQWSRAIRNSEECCIILLDIDHFKKINDNYGHHAGDIVLVGVAKTLDNMNRSYDRLGRWGGEEFLLFLPNTNSDQAITIAERLRSKVAESSFKVTDELSLNVTISVGIACKGSSDTLDLDRLIDHSDQALYKCKKEGRNRVSLFQKRA